MEAVRRWPTFLIGRLEGALMERREGGGRGDCQREGAAQGEGGSGEVRMDELTVFW